MKSFRVTVVLDDEYGGKPIFHYTSTVVPKKGEWIEADKGSYNVHRVTHCLYKYSDPIDPDCAEYMSHIEVVVR